ncbi:hypothetical protein GIY23_03060 [Allosaccharopolyspora coralli]|uniref:Uncharacterized protein n=1 Tax=Allosaccharopolyspora coralli TaxID=2665642 RepID=A0A5Q3Q289_9PSEU|nr:hypothetical protein [Allosaccharopolyspora coralli]QGK68671.1 hypothetical protein GIY23_03060 [Allosaccharopolyspora coralli]
MDRDDVSYDGQDRMEHSFDELRLSATRLRMQAEDGAHHAAAINTGDPRTDALINDVLGQLTGATAALADQMDATTDTYAPLYQEYKRSRESDRADDPDPD